MGKRKTKTRPTITATCADCRQPIHQGRPFDIKTYKGRTVAVHRTCP